MLTLFYAPGACSLAAHIVLEESGEKYEPKRVDLAKGEQRTEAYLKIHPQGRVPALRLDSGEAITENTAILPYLGKRFRLWPADEMAQDSAMSTIGFFAASVHPAHSHVRRPERYTADQSAFPGIKDMGLKTFHGYLSRSMGDLPAVNGFPTNTACSILTPSCSTPGACVENCRWRSSRTTRHSRTACCSGPLCSVSSRTRK